MKRINLSLCIILGLQPRDKAAMLVVNTKQIFLLNLHQNRIHFPAERNAFVLDHQHGRRDVTCKPAIGIRIIYLFPCLIMIETNCNEKKKGKCFLEFPSTNALSLVYVDQQLSCFRFVR